MTETMRAVLIRRHGGPEVLEIAELPAPQPGPGEVLIDVAAAGVLFNDTMIRSGFHPMLPPLPLVLGSEVVGTVIGAGAGVDAALLGRRVAVALPMGGYASRAVAPAAALVPLPDDLSDGEAVSLVVNAPTALVMLEDVAPVSGGRSVLVTAAAGAVGGLLLSAAAALGASPVIGAASAAKLDVVRGHGALAVDYGTPHWVDAVREATSGAGVNVVFESVGGEVGTAALRCLAVGGTLVQYGLASGRPTEVAAYDVIARGLRYLGFGLPHAGPARWLAASHRAIELWRAGALDLRPAWQLPLERARDAHEALRDRATTGKVVLTLH
jgi:NADPH:quinone reductase